MEYEQEPCAQPTTETDECWHMHFFGASSVEGNGDKVILFSPTEIPYQYSLHFNFECTNNIAEFEVLALGLQEALQLGCRHLQNFNHSELIVNMINGTYRPANKVFWCCINIIDQSIEHLLSFNLTHIRRERNEVVDKLAVFASSPSRQVLRERPSVEVISLYRYFVPNNKESWQVFGNDEDIDYFLAENAEDESPPSRIIDLKNNVYPKGLIPIENMFRHDNILKDPSPDPEPPRFKVGPMIRINVGTEAEPKTL